VNHNSASQARIEITYQDYRDIQAKLHVQNLPAWKSKFKFDGNAWEGPASDMLDMINSVYEFDESFRLSNKTQLETFK